MTRAQKIHDEIAAMIEVKYATKNGAYKAGTTITPRGAVNHSIGCAQPSADVMFNAMNTASAGWGVSAILGDFHRGPGRIILTLPLTRRNWGVGGGAKGSHNDTRVQWEVCEPSGHTYAGGRMINYDVEANTGYFLRMWALLVKWNVYVAVELGFSAAEICDHAESHRAGMGSNHGDLGHWLPKHGKSMDNLRAEVAAILSDGAPEEPTKPIENVGNSGAAIGDVVNFSGGYHYGSSDAKTPTGRKREAGAARVTAKAPGAAHPYHLIPHGGDGASDVYGWVDASTITTEKGEYNIGDVVNFSGGYHYGNSATKTAAGRKRAAGRARVTAKAPGAAHPYHLIAVDGGTSDVYGWVDASTIAGKIK